MTERNQLRDHFVLAGHCTPVSEGVAVGLAGGADVVEAGVALAGPTGLRRIDGIQVPDDRLHRRRQAVEVEAVEARLRRGMALCVVARSEPLHELEDLAVAPHPRREPTEVGERRIRVAVERHPHHVPVHAVCIGPVGFDGDCAEAVVVDEPAGDSSPLAVELPGPVGGLAYEDETMIAD